MSRGLGLALALVLAVSPSARAADARLLDQAQQAIDDIDYATARRLATQGLAEGALDRADLERAYRLLGESAAALGDGAAAREQFTRWLVLAPDATLGAGVSPKIAGPFADARAAAAKLGAFAADVSVERQPDRVVVALAGADPLAMVAGMRIRLGDASEVSVTDRRAVLPTAAAGAVTVAVVVIDRGGNQLLRRELRGVAATHAPPPPPPSVARRASGHRWPTLVRWPTWTGVAVVAAGVGGYFAWQVGKTEDQLAALNATSGQHSFDDALALRDRGEAQALFANLGFGVAGAAAVAAVLTFALEPRAAVEVAPAPGGATVGTTIRF